MKDKKAGIIRLIVCVVVMGVAIALGFITGLINTQNFGDLKFDAATLLKLVIMVFGVLAAVTLICFILGLFNPKNHRARSLLSIISSLLKYVAAIVILCWGLSIVGVNVSTIVASVGIVALIVGFSAESLISDVVTGAFMLFENQYNVGDIVEVNGFRGTVREIGIRTTSIADTGDNIKIINNSDMKNLLNRSDKTSRTVTDIGIPYETDLEKLEAELPALMERLYEDNKDLFLEPPVYLGVQELSDSAVKLRFVASVSENNIFSANRALNRGLFLGFRKLGVECPFTQIDIHSK